MSLATAIVGATAPAAPAGGGFVSAAAHPLNLTAYRWVLLAHGDWRWVVLISGFIVVVSAAMRLAAGRPWAPFGARASRFFGIAVDIQVLMGAGLYLVLSPLTTEVVGSAVMRLPRGSVAYFFAVEHPVIMIGAFIAVHISSVLVRRARSDAGHQRRAIIFYGITLLIILAGIPWNRPLLRF